MVFNAKKVKRTKTEKSLSKEKIKVRFEERKFKQADNRRRRGHAVGRGDIVDRAEAEMHHARLSQEKTARQVRKLDKMVKHGSLVSALSGKLPGGKRLPLRGIKEILNLTGNSTKSNL